MSTQKVPAYRRLAGRAGLGTDIGATVFLQGFGALLAYAVNSVINRSLSPSDWDSYSLAMHAYIVIGSAVMDFGIIAVIMPRIAAVRGEYSQALKAALVLRLITFALGMLVVLGLSAVYGDFHLMLPAAIGFCGALVSSKFTGIRQVPEQIWRIKGRTWVISTIALMDGILLLGSMFLLWYLEALTVVTAMIALVVANIPGFLLVALPVLRGYRRSPWSGRRIPNRYYRAIVIEALPIAVMALISQIFARVEPLVLNATMGEEYVGGYIVGILPLAGTIFLAVTIGVGMLPLVSQIHNRTRSDVSKGWVISVGSRLLGGIALLLCGACFLFADDILRLFNPETVQYAYILRIFSITVGLEYLVVFFDQSLLAVDSRKEVMIGTVLSLVLALTFQVAAVAYWGIVGIMFGKIAAVALKIVYQLKVLGSEVRRETLKGFLRLAVGAVVLAGTLYLSESLHIVLRSLIVFGGVIATLFLARIVDRKELGRLRRLQLT